VQNPYPEYTKQGKKGITAANKAREGLEGYLDFAANRGGDAQFAKGKRGNADSG
jgi:hypothetical protein